MSEGNLSNITYGKIIEEITEDIKYLQKKMNRILCITNTALLIKSKEKKYLFLEELKSKLTHTELCIFDSLLDIRKLMSYELPKGWSIIVILDSLDFRWVRKIMSRTSVFQVE